MTSIFSDQHESVFGLKRRIYSYICEGIVSTAILDALLPNGEPLLYEKPLWDYKLDLPVLNSNVKPNQTTLDDHNAKVSEIIKDVVSFYNSYGGYLIIGVRDKPRLVEGFHKQFDVDDLNKRIKAATGHDIDCHFSLITHNTNNKNVSIGILFIPQRNNSVLPVAFKQTASKSSTGKSAYTKDQIFLRATDECRPAASPDDYAFLCTPDRRVFVASNIIPNQSVLDNNLGAEDPGLIKFIGREEYLNKLWQWLLQRFAPCKLLAGIGGVGKTTIARKFAETIINESPLGFERVIWISAKKKYWRAYIESTEPAMRQDVRYFDTTSLLKAVLLELGYFDSEVTDKDDLSDLIDLVINTLRLIPSFVVVDDLDSLDPSEQQLAFQTLQQIFGINIRNGISTSRVLITARLDLGAAPTQLLKVTGLNPTEFKDYVNTLLDSYEINRTILENKSLLKKFFEATDGSPTFASSIIRLVSLGENLSHAIENWKGSDGEEVRKFAFEREIKFLSDNELRILFALCELGRSSAVELQYVLDLNKTRIRDGFSALKKYHLLIREDNAPAGGADISVPNSIRLMQSVIESHVRDFSRIRAKCKDFRSGIRKQKKLDVGLVINRIAALWKTGEMNDALEVAKWANKQDPSQPDISCIMGRAFLKVSTDKDCARQADAAFRNAYQNGNERTELFSLWIEAKQLLEDWHGIIEVTKNFDKRRQSADNIYYRAYAYQQLGEEALARRDIDSAAEYFKQGAIEIKQAFDQQYAKGRVSELLDLKTSLAIAYVDMLRIFHRDPNNYLYIWQGCELVFNLKVRNAGIIKYGIDKLLGWWDSVEIRDSFDKKSVNTLDVQISGIKKMLTALTKQGRSEEDIYFELQNAANLLEERKNHYIEHL